METDGRGRNRDVKTENRHNLDLKTVSSCVGDAFYWFSLYGPSESVLNIEDNDNHIIPTRLATIKEGIQSISVAAFFQNKQLSTDNDLLRVRHWQLYNFPVDYVARLVQSVSLRWDSNAIYSARHVKLLMMI